MIQTLPIIYLLNIPLGDSDEDSDDEDNSSTGNCKLYWSSINLSKRDSTIEKQLPRWSLNSKIQQMSLISPSTQMINPFLNSWITANHDKVEGLSVNSKKRGLFLSFKKSFIYIINF